ncbi:MAG: penicillin-binding protein 1C, partial [Bacteroidia bacterium]|nr:penicillin-binding protein 1C [Bacteroidia bacterium]
MVKGKSILSFKLLRNYWYLLPLIVFLLVFLFSLPRPLFKDPCSTVLFDRNGVMLGAKISMDGQWRFEDNENVPDKFRIAVTLYEDRWFRYHPGFNPVSMARAVYLNIKHGRIVSGGSTISMQVIRLARKNHDRTIIEKLIELFLAFKLEFSNSKEEIMGLYASHAPFGGNVVGIDAASWRYYGISPDHLSWAEAATLAVLPNSPSLIYPGKNQRILLDKRNKLLDKLMENGYIDKTSCQLAKCESLPGKPMPLPQSAPHLTERAVADGYQGRNVITTLDIHLQEKINAILEAHYPRLEANEVHNAAAIVLDVSTGNVLAYAGNVKSHDLKDYGNDVDMIISPRSTGSILKPFLYGAMLNDGLLLPTSLVPDVPMQIGSFIPENYSLSYDGAVPAKNALSRSLNIPAVKMLQSYGYNQFYTLLKKIGITTLTNNAEHYGLSLILGGAEARLWDLAGIYSSMARTLNHFNVFKGYNKNDYHPPVYISKTPKAITEYSEKSSWYDAASIWLVFQAMVEVSRPDEELFWQQFSSSSVIAWKTGTSFGNRDA